MGLLVAAWPKADGAGKVPAWAWHLGSVASIALIGWYVSNAKWDDVHFLGPWLSIMELSAAVLMVAGSRLAWLGKPLSIAPLVVIGQLSYGLYLWHYPLMRMPLPMDINSMATNIMAGIFALMLAWLSWRLIEDPIRRRVSTALRS